MTKPVNDRRIQ